MKKKNETTKAGKASVEKPNAGKPNTGKPGIENPRAGKIVMLSTPPIAKDEAAREGWTFLSNHAHVLVCLAREGDATLREVASRVGITERAVLRIVADLESSGVLKRARDGRRNRYEVDASQPLRHAIEAHKTVNDLLKMVEESAASTRAD